MPVKRNAVESWKVAQRLFKEKKIDKAEFYKRAKVLNKILTKRAIRSEHQDFEAMMACSEVVELFITRPTNKARIDYNSSGEPILICIDCGSHIAARRQDSNQTKIELFLDGSRHGGGLSNPGGRCPCRTAHQVSNNEMARLLGMTPEEFDRQGMEHKISDFLIRSGNF